MAVARLLKEQGKWRQIVAVTHNPLIAALADKHFVVSKKTYSVHNDDNDMGLDDGRNNDNNSHDNDDNSININNNDDNNNNDNNNNEIINHSNNNINKISNDNNQYEKIKKKLMYRNHQLKSSLQQVLDNDRENEIARMATGGTHTDAGLNLAKALLGGTNKNL